YRVLTSRKYLSFATHSLIFIVLTGLVFASVKTKANWTKGQSENAVSAMVGSVLAANASHSFFTADIPFNSEPFNPKKAEPENTVFEFNQNQQIENILFIVLESAGAEYFDAYGGTFQLSPNLNKYASQAVI